MGSNRMDLRGPETWGLDCIAEGNYNTQGFVDFGKMAV